MDVPDFTKLPKYLLNKEGTMEEFFCISCGSRWWGREKRESFRCGICMDYGYQQETVKTVDDRIKTSIRCVDENSTNND